MTNFGLLGKNISYSFSKKYFEEKFIAEGLDGYQYHLLHQDELHHDLLQNLAEQQYKGLNVTIPYKKEIIPYLTDLDAKAEVIGAVNTILIRKANAKFEFIGYNTDYDGFLATLQPYLPLSGPALILGDGGAAQAVKAVLRDLQLDFVSVARRREINFENLHQDTNIVRSARLIVNCTPVGTYPNVDDCLPFPFELLHDQQIFIDLIYNPAETRFLALAKEAGCKTENGLKMLHAQAEAAWKIWMAG